MTLPVSTPTSSLVPPPPIPSRIQCHLLSPTAEYRVTLRRFLGGKHGGCPAATATTLFCDAFQVVDVVHWNGGQQQLVFDAGSKPGLAFPASAIIAADDPRWPQLCDACHRPFSAQVAGIKSYRHVLWDMLWSGSARQGLVCLDSAPLGSIWNAPQLTPGVDGLSLVVKIPTAAYPGWCDWQLDGRAKNCLRSDPHQCWEREGVPPLVTVKKGGCGGPRVETIGWRGTLVKGVLIRAEQT